MTDALERLLTLRVSDLMRKDVVTVSCHQTMSDAAAVLAEHEISGAPVIDAQGRCVGVLTATDFLYKEAGHLAATAEGERRLERCGGKGAYSISPIGHELVGDRMSTAVQSVQPDSSLISAARVMCDTHVHRLLVIDNHQLPVGVLTTLDVVAALVNAIDEAHGPRSQP